MVVHQIRKNKGIMRRIPQSISHIHVFICEELIAHCLVNCYFTPYSAVGGCLIYMYGYIGMCLVFIIL